MSATGFNPLEMDKSRYKDVTVTYRLYSEQLDAVQMLADSMGYTLEQQLDFMMNCGSAYDIQDKINFYIELHKKKALFELASKQESA